MEDFAGKGDAIGLVSWPAMRPTDRARLQLARLYAMGIDQKVIAGKMGVSQSTLSRWFRQVPDGHGRTAKLSAEALDRLEDFFDDCRAGLEETHRATATLAATGGKPFPHERPDRRQKDDGPPPGVEERRRVTESERHEA